MEKTNVPWKSIVNFLNKEESKEASEVLENWIREDVENAKIFDEIYNVQRLNGISYELLIPDKEKAWQKIECEIEKKEASPFQKLFYRYKFVISVVAIVVVVFFIIILNQKFSNHKEQFTEVISPLGQKTMVKLPDSSFVWLNSGSTLKYSSNFNVKERKVTLEGEAFFDVHKDKSKKFRVKSGILYIDVYGTSFNIKNREDDQFQEITVSEGKVGISDSKREIRQLTIGEQARLNKVTNKISFTYNDPNIVSAWKDNELIFDDTPMSEVIKYLERWYGVKITVDKKMLGKHRYTFKIKTESFYEMLEKMKIITPSLAYVINGKDVKLYYNN